MNTLYDFDTIAPFDPLLSRMHPDGRVMTDVEVTESWKPLRDVSEDVYLLLSSSLVAGALYRMRQTLQLSDDASMRIASLLRMYYFGKAPFEQFPLFLKNDVRLPQEKIAVVMNFIRTEILPLKIEKKVEEDDIAVKPNILSLQLLQALEKFPRVNDQQLTRERIKVRSEKDTVRGTVRNWLRAYRDVVGARQHTAIERGSFLFQSENAKNLSTQERDRVGVLLKSLDENEVLQINPERQEISFPASDIIPDKSGAPAASLHRQGVIAPIADVPSQRVAEPKSVQQPSMPKPNPVQRETPRPAASLQATDQSLDSRAREITASQRTRTVPAKNFNFSKSNPAVSASILPSASVPPLSLHQLSNDSGAASPFRFSSGHTLPAEKSAVDRRIARPATQTPAQKKEVWQVPASLQNVVDLRSNE